MIYLQIFFSFVQIGLFSIGGGYASIPLIQNEIVEIHHWLTLSEFTDLITIAGMTPGPIAINAATFVGLRISGLGGAVVATVGYVIPSYIIVSILAFFYCKYRNLSIARGVLSSLRPAVVALIASAGLSIFILSVWGESGFSLNKSNIDYIAIILFLAAMFTIRKFKIDPIFIIGGSGLAGILLYLIV